MVVGEVELRVVHPAVDWLNDLALLVPVFGEGELFVQSKVSVEELHFISHLYLLTLVDLSHVLAMLLRNHLVQDLPWIVALLVLFVFVVV